MIISNESMNFKDPKESDDPQLFDDPSSCYSMIARYSMTRIPNREKGYFPKLSNYCHVSCRLVTRSKTKY